MSDSDDYSNSGEERNYEEESEEESDRPDVEIPKVDKDAA